MNAPCGVNRLFVFTEDKEKMSEKQISIVGELPNLKNKPATERENFTDKEAADYLRTSTVSLWRARRRGLITYRRVLGKILYTKTDLLDFLERSKRGGYADSK